MKDIFKSIYIYHLKKHDYNISQRINAIKYLRIIGYDFQSALDIHNKAMKITNKFSTNNKDIKSNLRLKIKEERSNLSEDIINQASQQICKSAAEVLQNNNIKKVALYSTIKHKKEIDTNYLFDIIVKNGIEAYYPTIQSQTLSFARVQELTDLEESDLGKFGFSIPKNKETTPISDIDAFILPGLSFNPITGTRLGYGMGHYDRALKDSKALKIGLVLSMFINKNLPAEEFDVDVNCIITENDTIWINK